MKRKIFIKMCLLSTISILMSSALILTISFNSFNSTMKKQVKSQGNILATLLRQVDNPAFFLSELKEEDNRISIVDNYGNVIFDTHAKTENLDNHINRPEISKAMIYGVAAGTRFSNTLKQSTFYYAVRLNENLVLRISADTASISNIFMQKYILIAIIAFVIFLMCTYISSKLINSIIEPINQLDLETNNDNIVVYDELSAFVRKIINQNKQIKQQIFQLEYRANTISAITDNMGEGLIMLDKFSTVLSVNNSALEILSVKNDCKGQNIIHLTRNLQIIELVKQAQKGSSTSEIIKLKHKFYQIMANSVQGQGAILLILDVTHKENADIKRREFSANVSHELKTPLTSISGFAEMIESGMAKDKDVKKFANKIRQETTRLISLVQDIIKLSELDESTIMSGYQKVNLYKITQSVVERLSDTSSNKSITLSLTGDNAYINGDQTMLDELVYNLCDNAIKYNKENGKVDISVTTIDHKITVEVADSGIGIAPEHIGYIFERFYRVDKSRSKKTGGTGLGLAIAKHIVEHHGGVITAKSQLNKGSTITVLFDEIKDAYLVDKQ